jgi:hypothetical protein
MAAANVRAVTTFWCEVDGKDRQVAAGQVLAASDPVVKGRKELFEPADKPTA